MGKNEIYHGVRLDNGEFMQSASFYRSDDGRVFLATAGTDIAVSGDGEHEIVNMASVSGDPIFVEIDKRTFGKKV